jgi:hypothetical protein
MCSTFSRRCVSSAREQPDERLRQQLNPSYFNSKIQSNGEGRLLLQEDAFLETKY